MSAPERTQLDVSGLLNEAGHTLTNRLAAALAEIGLTPRTQCVLPRRDLGKRPTGRPWLFLPK